MDVEDLTKVVETMVSIIKKKLSYGHYCIKLVLFL